MASDFTVSDLTERGLKRLAEDLVFAAAAGDVIALEGDLGAGKTTFARAFIREAVGDLQLEVPSPTFTLSQSYAAARFAIAHFDLYRISNPRECDELGIEAALDRGVALIEWPDRGGDRLPSDHWTIRIEESDDGARRNAHLSATPAIASRLSRMLEIRAFLDAAGWSEYATTLSYLQGDASPRRYARLTHDDGRRSILMDSPAATDGPPVRDGLPYSRIAHLAEDVRAFVAVDLALRERGFAAPEILAHDLDRGLLLIEDFGDAVFGAEVARGREQTELWRRAIAVLAALRSAPPEASLPLPDGSFHHLRKLDAGVLDVETALLLDWYWPAAFGEAAPETIRQSFTSAWRDVFASVLSAPLGWMLRDFHSPNLIALDDRPAPRDVGMIDFQDALRGPLAFDVVSLLQDARLDVPAEIEDGLLRRYIDVARAAEPAFEEAEFRYHYAALGAQRNTKILGIFARLAKRDGKLGYLRHMPRIWGYLERNLQHPRLAEVGAWYDAHIPAAARTRSLKL